MARTIARFKCALWTDTAWCSLTKDAQRAYHLILEQGRLSLAGHLDLMPQRWAGLAVDDTVDALNAALRLLHDRGYIVIDWTTGELLVRTFARHDITAGRLNRNLVIGYWSAWGTITSPLLRRVVVENTPDELWSFNADFVPTGAEEIRRSPRLEPEDYSRLEPTVRTEEADSVATNHVPGSTIHVPCSVGHDRSRLAEPKHLVELLEPNGVVALRRDATALLDIVMARTTELPILASERGNVLSCITEALKAGYDPDDIADAAATAPFRTTASIMGQLRLKKQPKASVGNDSISEAVDWVQGR